MKPLHRVIWFFKIAETIAEASPDRSTKVGCIIVGPDYEIRAQGYNGFPRGFDDERTEYHERPFKYDLVVHAEANAIANAARTGVCLKGCVAYVTHPPCCHCASLLVNSGVSRVVWRPGGEDFQGRWKRSNDIALDIFLRSGVETTAFQI